MVVTSSELEDPIAQAVEHRRNFAIISHPDAGKTTVTYSYTN
jgi:peptide chain release factor 3